MRERLTAAFVVLTVTLLLGALLTRSYTTDARFRAYESDQVNAQAETMAAFLSLRMDAGLPINENVLTSVVGADQRIEYDAVGGQPVAAEGDSFDEGNDGQDFGAVVEIPEHDATLVLPPHRRPPAKPRRSAADVPRRRRGTPHHPCHLGRRGAHRPR